MKKERGRRRRLKAEREGADRKRREERTRGNNAEVEAGWWRGAREPEITMKRKGSTEGRRDGTKKTGLETRRPEMGTTEPRRSGAEEKGLEAAGEGAVKAGLDAKEGRRRREDEKGEMKEVLSGATHTTSGEETTTTSQKVGSETDMDLTEITQLRKRQNTQLYMRINKKSKNKEKPKLKY